MDLIELGFMLCDFEQPQCVRNNDLSLHTGNKRIVITELKAR